MNEDFMWAIGVFEGEGTITTDGHGRWNVKVEMTDVDVIYRLKRAWSVGNITTRKRPNRQQTWTLRLSRQEDVKWLLESILPFLSVRRTTRALEALQTL